MGLSFPGAAASHPVSGRAGGGKGFILVLPEVPGIYLAVSHDHPSKATTSVKALFLGTVSLGEPNGNEELLRGYGFRKANKYPFQFHTT